MLTGFAGHTEPVRFDGLGVDHMSFDHDCGGDVFAPGGHIRSDYFRTETIEALNESLRFAQATRWDSLRSPHVFMGLLSSGDAGVQEWADRLGADLPRLIEQFVELFMQDDVQEVGNLILHREFFSDNVINLLRDARERAVEHQRDSVSPMDLLIIQFTTPNSIVAECFERIGVTAARLTELAVLAEQVTARPVET